MEKVICSDCGSLKNETEFFKYRDTKFDICKKCLTNKFNAEVKSGASPKDTMLTFCEMLDKPFHERLFNSTLGKTTDSDKLLGTYLKNIAMQQYIKNGIIAFSNSVYEVDTNTKNISITSTGDNVDGTDDDTQDDLDIDKKPPKRLVDKWGKNYKYRDYINLEKFFDDMMKSHDISTPQHIKLLVFMCKIQDKMDKCLDIDDSLGFNKYFEQYNKLLQTAGFRPIDSKSAAEMTNIRSFAQVFEEVEKTGFLEPARGKYKQDILDKEIMYMLNYTLVLLNKEKLAIPPIDTPKLEEDELKEEEVD